MQLRPLAPSATNATSSRGESRSASPSQPPRAQSEGALLPPAPAAAVTKQSPCKQQQGSKVRETSAREEAQYVDICSEDEAGGRAEGCVPEADDSDCSVMVVEPPAPEVIDVELLDKSTKASQTDKVKW